MACGKNACGSGQQERLQRGQSTVEYALVLLAFLSVAVALAVVWHAGKSGLLDRAVGSSSHRLGGGDMLGSFRDILLY